MPYTNLTRITEPDAEDYEPIAPNGGLSPFSTTTLGWQRQWPLKPDIVLEGGNAAADRIGAVTIPSLSLLTTHHDPTNRLFTTTTATSAATALASRMAAQVMATYPKLWPESIRALIVHSAEWTDAMKRAHLPPSPHQAPLPPTSSSAVATVCLIWVAPLWTVANSLTMVVQRSLQPFQKQPGKRPTTRDMHLHRLPWPQEALESLGATEVEMRVTLSYFIEPNPSQRGNSRYRYQSHGLRFDVKRPTETLNMFQARVNAAMEREEPIITSDPLWLLGINNRHRGSLHSDIWRGTAAELASRAQIAVFPHHRLVAYPRPGSGCVNRNARYSLVVSIRAPDTEVDLYTEVANRIAVSIEA